MLLLTGTTTALRLEIVSGSASIGYSSSYTDQNATTGAFVASQGTLNASITSGDVAIVSAPSSGNSRNIKHVTISNQSVADTSVIHIYLFATPNSNDQWYGSLAAKERVIFDECGSWTYYAADGTRK
jgi:hypothetical protein